MNYLLPDPKDEKQWIRCLVLSYKTLKGVPHDDRIWDKTQFTIWAPHAKKILLICKTLRDADACLVDYAKIKEEKGHSWYLSSVVPFAYEWLAKNRSENTNGNEARQRFFDAIAKQRGKNDEQRGRTPSGSSEDTGGDLSEVWEETSRNHDPREGNE